MLVVLDILSHWVTHIVLVLVLALITHFIQKRIVIRLIAKLKTTKTFWDHIILEALQAPIGVLIGTFTFSFVGEILQQSYQLSIPSWISLFRKLAFTAIAAWFLLRFIKEAQKNFLEKKAHDKSTVDAIGKILNAIVIITTGITMLQSLGMSISGVLAFGGIGGIAVGFAAKDVLANFFGAFMIYWDRPFKVGDWIRSPDREIEGIVENIGWRLTQIRTFDKRPLYVPNAVFNTISVENPARMSHRRIYETIRLRYKDNLLITPILEEIKLMLIQHPEIDEKQILMVNLNEYGPHSINFFIYTFTHTIIWTEFHRVKEDVLLKVHQIIADHGAELAPVESTIHISDSSQKHLLEIPTRLSHTVEHSTALKKDYQS